MATDTTTDPEKDTTGSLGAVSAFGGDTTWKTLQDLVISDLTKTGVTKPGELPADDSGLTESELASKFAFSAVKSMNRTLEVMEQPTQQLLSGKIPDDVTAQIRQLTAERSGQAGLFGQASRGLLARDLGKTSLEVMSQGLEMAKTRMDIASRQAELSQTRTQFLETLDLQRKELNAKAVVTEVERAQFNATMNFSLLELVTKAIQAQQDSAFSYSANKLNPANTVSSYRSWIDVLRSKL